MAFWQELGDKISDPAVIAVIVAAMLGGFVYRRQLVTKRKIELTEKHEKTLGEIFETLSEIINSYKDAMSALANLGDKYKGLQDAPDEQTVKNITKEINDKYDIIGKAIKATHKAKLRNLEVISALASDPMITKRFGVVANILNKESDEVGRLMDRTNSLLIPLNTLPSNLSGGQTISPQLFRAIVDIVNANITKLQEFQLYTQDIKRLMHNELIGGAFLFGKYKPAYLEVRRAMTMKGIRDYSVETSRWTRIKVLIRTIWG